MRKRQSILFEEIESYLNTHSDSITLVYSPAHLQDLKRSYFQSEKGKIETIKDLEFLGEMTNDHCLCYETKKKSVYPNILSPALYFQDVFVKNKDLNFLDFENIFDEDFLNPSAYSRIVSTPNFSKQSKLGKLLFYDPIMSKDFTKTCATCHNPKLAFTDGMKVMLEDQPSSQSNRNTPTLINSIYSKQYFHDMRASKPDLQVDHVVYNDEEFNIDYSELINRLTSNEAYSDLFSEAFSDNKQPITRYTITTSITQYMTSLSGFDSPFDRYMRDETADLDGDVIKGFNLFMGKGACGSCHFSPTFSGLVPPGFEESESEILGILATNDFDRPILDQDPGRMQNGNLKEASEIYHRSFKTPTVRNVSLTAPYMHNGVHTTLEEVLTFYNNGGGQGMGLNVPYQTLPPDSLGLTTTEQNQIIRFMESLIDTVGMTSIPQLPDSSKQDQNIGK